MMRLTTTTNTTSFVAVLFIIVSSFSSGTAISVSSSSAPHLRGASERQQQQQQQQQQRERRLVVGETSCIVYVGETKYALEGQEQQEQQDEDDIIKYSEKEQLYCEFESNYARTVLGINDPLVELNGLSQSDIGNARVVAPVVAPVVAFTASADGSLQRTPQAPQENREALQPQAPSQAHAQAQPITSGQTIITFREGIIDRTDNVMYVDKTLVMEVAASTTSTSNINNDSFNRLLQTQNRRLKESPSAVGTKQALVVRIITSTGIEPEVTRNEIRKQVYDEDSISLVSQYKACSYGKLTITPYEGNTISGVTIQDGIIDITLSTDISTEFTNTNTNLGTLARYVREATVDALGDIDENSIHLVMFVFPKGIAPFMATAITNRYDSYYTKKWLLPPSFHIHEIGHNLGLKHSGENGNEYADKTGYMGYSYTQYDGPSMCFNAAQSYKLGWYDEQTLTYNPLSLDESDSTTNTKQFTLNGVDDYNNPTDNDNDNDASPLIVLRLLQEDLDADYYIGYNKDTGINKGTFENKNEILIIHKDGTPESTSQIMKNRTISNVGDYIEITNFNSNANNADGDSDSVYVLFQSLSEDKKDAVIIISTTIPVYVNDNEEEFTITDTNSAACKDSTDKFKWNKNKNNNKIKYKSCKWLSKKSSSKIKTLCKKKKQRQKVWIRCPTTCGNVGLGVCRTTTVQP
ncbi:hypothetical protein FRACYDRAFT_240700 [Fragilariopsis cylindrus CCMP1102]|uniref:Peptidase M11 gametolysin domain-containing protein n=1 Tax=Fragilariopsis cylindrus CCMP1102 TaxID=635003 RepID=A0A1E7F7R1_9STRA|nr:hypothetical protein FRACYDRAFT_240700 [Fragilariopsis cylindrus CCMP1102]|eukprot:OEU14169.1 hypothetical protein FRACYDRAFT_240700 [Fragilariopsis cylindrus CCMP1102]